MHSENDLSNDDDHDHDLRCDMTESSSDQETKFPVDASETYKIHSFKKDVAFQKGKAPESVFEQLYRETLESKLIKMKLKFNKGYQVTELDISDGVYSGPKKVGGNGFEVFKKHLLILKIGFRSQPVVFTIEKLMNPEHTKSVVKVIKTLRIYDTNSLRETKSILLEEINVKKYEIENYEFRPTILTFRKAIYFYRRMGNKYHLFKYDFVSNEMSEMMATTGQYQILLDNDIGLYIRFA